MTEPEDRQPVLKTENRLLSLAAELSFLEPVDLTEARKAINSTQSLEEFRGSLNNYLEAGERIIDKVDDNLRPRAQIGLILTTAQIYYSKGLLTESSEALGDAWEYAYQLRDNTLVLKIGDIWFSDPKYTYKRTFPSQ